MRQNKYFFMKFKNNLSLLSILLSMATFIASPLKAQVTIGALTPPQPFSLLELSTANVKGGLRLPQLSTTERDALNLASNPDSGAGLLIYNTTTNCLEFWNHDHWVSLCGNSAQSASINPSSVYGGVQAIYSIAPVAGATGYTWTAPSGWIITGGQNTPVITAIPGGKAAIGNVSVTVSYSSGSGMVLSFPVIEVKQCSAMTTDGTKKLIFMCFNLGADTSKDPSEDYYTTYGDLYQWGRPADGHQLRNSPTTTTLSANDVPGNNNFILSSNDWRRPSNDNLWGETKTANDPCPPGWKVPSADQ